MYLSTVRMWLSSFLFLTDYSYTFLTDYSYTPYAHYL